MFEYEGKHPIGTEVEVAFKGKIVSDAYGYVKSGYEDDGYAGFIVVQDADGIRHIVYRSNTTEAHGTVKLTGPANWPPREGDVWTAGAKEFYVRKREPRSVTSAIRVVNFADTSDVYEAQSSSPYHTFTIAKSLDQFKALKPTLARRRGA